MSETPPLPDDAPAGTDPWFHPTPPHEHAAACELSEPGPAPPAEAPAPAAPPGSARDATTDRVADAIPVAIVLAAFAIAARVVPTMTQVATAGDWGYIRSVEILLDEGTLKIFPVGATAAVGHVLWGALFGAVFGMSPGMMRVSTVVMVAIGAVALYAILRQLGVSRGRGALGVAIWLFNPLTFSLAFTFMADAHFASAMLIAVALSMRGLRPGGEDLRWIAAGSLAAAFAVLIREQGALVPIAVGMALLLARPYRGGRGAVGRLLAVAAAPLLALTACFVWLRWLNDAPPDQRDILDEARAAGWDGTLLLIRRISVYVAFYAGLLLAPVLAALAPWRHREARRPVSAFMVYLATGWATFILTALYLAGRHGQQMPFAPQFVGLSGLGPTDVPGGRQRLVPAGGWETTALTVVAAGGAIILGVVVLRALGGRRRPERAGFWLVSMVGLWQLAGIVPTSYDALHRGVTLDRYLLPVIPLAIAVALWALRDVDLMPRVSWALLAVVAAFSIAGTRDYLVFLDRVWDMAAYANAQGVENDRLDAGSAWDGYHLSTAMLDAGGTVARSPSGSDDHVRPTDAGYIVATRPDVRRGYVVVASDAYDLWLDDDPGRVYLLRRWSLPFPVTSQTGPGRPGTVLPGARPGPVSLVPAPTPVASPAP